tara:strand:+ start:2611 stop:3219 length:609 start_codon:yes stop_codon:yes gene_type:complete
MDIHEFFPVKFYTFDNPELAEPMLEALQGEQRSLFNLPNMVETTKGNLHTLPEFAPLTNWIEECLEEIKKENQYQMEGKFQVSLMWGNVSGPDMGGCHQAHRHPFAYYSGIYYLTTGSPTIFQDPLTPRTMNQLEIISKTYENAIAIEPQVGQLIIFPSWMVHWSVPHHGDKLRAGIAWNALPVGGVNFGPYGQNMVDLELK